MRITRISIAAIVMLAGALAAPSAQAAVTPISLTCGTLIDTPGSYRATNNVVACGNAVIVDIAADNVTLDLDGHLVGGDDINCDEAVTVAPGKKDITIRNGTVRDCNDGIAADGSGPNIAVKDILATSNDVNGILLENDSSANGNFATRNGSNGIRGLNDNKISKNTVADNDASGIDVESNNFITKNEVIGNDDGIVGDNGNTISKNTVTGVGGDGIDASDNNIVTSNVVRGSFFNGISVSNNNTVTKNVVTENEDDGIDTSDDNTIKSNLTRGNGSSGILVNAANIVVANRAHDNGGDGIRIFVSSATTTIKKNVANNNGLLGIDAAAGVLGTGTNKAKGNGAGPPECDPPDLCV